MIATGVLVGGLALGWLVGAGVELHVDRDLAHHYDATVLWQILGRNVPAVLMFFSGVLTVGLTTIVSWSLTSVYIGVIVGSAVADVGALKAFEVLAPYAVFEVSGLLCAAAAGIAPVSAAAQLFLAERTVARAGRDGVGTSVVRAGTTKYLEVVKESTWWLSFALAAIVVGALVETWEVLT